MPQLVVGNGCHVMKLVSTGSVAPVLTAKVMQYPLHNGVCTVRSSSFYSMLQCTYSLADTQSSGHLHVGSPASLKLFSKQKKALRRSDRELFSLVLAQ